MYPSNMLPIQGVIEDHFDGGMYFLCVMLILNMAAIGLGEMRTR